MTPATPAGPGGGQAVRGSGQGGVPDSAAGRAPTGASQQAGSGLGKLEAELRQAWAAQNPEPRPPRTFCCPVCQAAARRLRAKSAGLLCECTACGCRFTVNLSHLLEAAREAVHGSG